MAWLHLCFSTTCCVTWNPNIIAKSSLTSTWFEHATFWSGVRCATIAPRSPSTKFSEIYERGLRILTCVNQLQKEHFNAMLLEWDYFTPPLKGDHTSLRFSCRFCNYLSGKDNLSKLTYITSYWSIQQAKSTEKSEATYNFSQSLRFFQFRVPQ